MATLLDCCFYCHLSINSYTHPAEAQFVYKLWEERNIQTSGGFVSVQGGRIYGFEKILEDFMLQHKNLCRWASDVYFLNQTINKSLILTRRVDNEWSKSSCWLSSLHWEDSAVALGLGENFPFGPRPKSAALRFQVHHMPRGFKSFSTVSFLFAFKILLKPFLPIENPTYIFMLPQNEVYYSRLDGKTTTVITKGNM